MSAKEIVFTNLYFDSPEGGLYRGYIIKGQRWNGWEMPYIHEEGVVKLLELWNDNNNYIQLSKDEATKVLTLTDVQEDFKTTIEPELMNGEVYYYFGNEGFIWEAETEY